MNEIQALSAEPRPFDALERHIVALCEQYSVTRDEVDVPQLAADLTRALYARRRMEELWPDAPADQRIYAVWARSPYDYGQAALEGCAIHACAVDWPRFTPHAYLASPVPLDLPQVDLLRLPLTP